MELRVRGSGVMVGKRMLGSLRLNPQGINTMVGGMLNCMGLEGEFGA